MNAPASQEFHLIIEDWRVLAERSSIAGSKANPGHPPLVVRRGVSRLDWQHRDAPRLEESPGLNSSGLPLIETIDSRPLQPRLLLLSPTEYRASVNGNPAPRIVMLAESDRFHFDDTCIFRVAIHHRSQLGPVPARLVGVACPICTVPLQAGDRCWVCPCGTAIHAAEDEARAGALACHQISSDCARCGRPIRLQPGYGELSSPTND